MVNGVNNMNGLEAMGEIPTTVEDINMINREIAKISVLIDEALASHNMSQIDSLFRQLAVLLHRRSAHNQHEMAQKEIDHIHAALRKVLETYKTNPVTWQNVKKLITSNPLNWTEFKTNLSNIVEPIKSKACLYGPGVITILGGATALGGAAAGIDSAFKIGEAIGQIGNGTEQTLGKWHQRSEEHKRTFHNNVKDLSQTNRSTWKQAGDQDTSSRQSALQAWKSDTDREFQVASRILSSQA